MKTKTLLLTAMATFGMTIATMAQNVPNYVPTNGLVGWWPFNGNANDESGNGNNGTVNGASLTSDRFMNVNKAYSFDGVDDKIEINHSNSLNTFPLSVVAWVRTNQCCVEGSSIVSKYLYGSSNGFGLSYRPWSGTFSGFYSTSAAQIQDTAAVYINNNSWHMVSLIVDNSGIKLFHNQLMIAQEPWTGLASVYTNTRNLLFGKSDFPSSVPINGHLSGDIDDIGIWNRSLTQQEITDLYNAVNCANNTAITPQINSLPTGSTATFTASTTDPNPSFVWQSDFGQGYVTLIDFGNYSGVNSATLNIANVQLSEHNQPIRVITTSGNCIDTSNIAIINIADTCIATIADTTFITVTDTLIINTTITSLNPPSNSNTIKVFPNPTNDHITIDYGNFLIMNGYQLKIENSLGQQVFQTSITQQSDYLNLTAWGGNGLYFVHIIDPQGNTIDIRKIVLQ